MLLYLILPEIHFLKNGDSLSGIIGWNISACIFYLYLWYDDIKWYGVNIAVYLNYQNHF